MRCRPFFMCRNRAAYRKQHRHIPLLRRLSQPLEAGPYQQEYVEGDEGASQAHLAAISSLEILYCLLSSNEPGAHSAQTALPYARYMACAHKAPSHRAIAPCRQMTATCDSQNANENALDPNAWASRAFLFARGKEWRTVNRTLRFARHKTRGAPAFHRGAPALRRC